MSTDTAMYGYDGAGNRLRAIRAGTETHYIYDASGKLLAEADASNTITRYYVHGAGLLADVTSADAVYCYHYDGVGNTVAITDGSQNVANSYDYSPFGMILSESETFAQPFKYVGKLGVMSEANGFFYMRARYYDPLVGRFISEDPKGFDGGDVNLYVYAGNNPVLLVDPWGLESGYPYSPTWSDVRTAGQSAVSATRQGVNTAVNLTVNGPAPARYTLQGALAIAGAPIAGSGAMATGRVIMNVARAHPGAIEAGSDFISSALPGVPVSNWAGAAGAAANYIYGKYTAEGSK